jgi:seryl-tRNA synthetase
MLKTPNYSLSPSACFHVYEEYKNTELERNTVITFTQSVFRNEGRFNFQEFGRMRDYHVREIVFIGSEDFVKNSRQLFIDKVKEIIEKMKIDAKISIASDSFILPHMQKYKKIQIIDNSKYELSFFYDEEHSVSVGSFNLHGTAFTVPFNFSVKDTETVTGCIGFGLERLVLTFLSQFGENEQNWPEEIRKKIVSNDL